MHNSHELFYRKPFGAVTCETQIHLRIKVACSPNDHVEVLLHTYINHNLKSFKMDEENRCKESAVFHIHYLAPKEPNVVWYHFEIRFNNQMIYYGNNWEKLGGEGVITEKDTPCYQITVHRNINIPEWYKSAIMYQIFVDRFFNGNEDQKVLSPRPGSLIHGDWHDTPYYIKDQLGRVVRWDFFGGNLQGIIKKLPYLKSLGVGVVYLNPVFEASSNHKYDTGNYKKIDPMFGTIKDFEELMAKGKENDIRFILDGVFSHTGSDSIYFNKDRRYSELGAYQSKESKYFNWYKFVNYPEEYESWWGVGTLPNVNEMEPSYQDYIYGQDGVIQHWIKKGAQGWRLDVADELPDTFIKTLRKNMKDTDETSVLIGEVWEDASNKVSYGGLREYLWGDELDSVMNYPFRSIVIDFALGYISGHKAMKKLMNLFENYPREIFYANINLLGTHDVERIMTILGEAENKQNLSPEQQEQYKLSEEKKELAIRRLKLISLIQMTFPGIPCIYYGDEAGMEGYADPFNRGPYPWGKENEELLSWYKKITHIRKTHTLFVHGEWINFHCNDDLLGYIRIKDEKKALCIFNRNSEKAYDIFVDKFANQSVQLIDLLEEEIVETRKKISIKPLQGRIFLADKK